MRFIACALLVIATTHAAEVCVPGEHRQDGENVCFCLGDGTGWTCAPGAQHLSNPLLREVTEVSDDDETCEPGKPFMSYCNFCMCEHYGRVGFSPCTKMACDLNVWNKDGSRKVPFPPIADEDRCEPGKPFKRYCNTCTCGPEGRADHSACTYMTCDLNVWNKDGTRKPPVANPLDENKCEPGQTFKRYCNTCTCGSEGRADSAVCTLIACDPNLWKKDGSLNIPKPTPGPLLDESDICEPGKPFLRYCNTCFCGAEGRADFSACTYMGCDMDVWNKNGTLKNPVPFVPNPLVRKAREVQDDEDRCEPGKTFKRYCNTCTCGPEGRAASSACTMMACDMNVWNKDGSLKNPEQVTPDHDEDRCEPGKPFKRYCNTCTCGPEGRAASSACTMMACDMNVWNKDGSLKNPEQVTPDHDEDRCEPGKPFKRYCNTCTCGPEGRSASSACTLMACDMNVWNKDGSLKNPEQVTPNHDEDRCEPGKTFKRYCNTCTCGPEGRAASSACTLMACDMNVWNKDGSLKNPEQVTPDHDEDRCEPGKPFKRYCNTCTCGPEGRAASSACTLMACDMNVWNKDGSLKNPEQVTPNHDEDRCEPGKPFKRYCNTCTCGPEGRAAFSACTMMACDMNVWNKDGTTKDTVGVQLELNQDTCEPGTRFKYYCNQCYCGPEGRVALSACTRMACHPAIWNKDGTMKLDFENGDNDLAKPTDETQDRCEPLKSFMKYCNHCTCGPDGLADNAACTKMYCDPNFWNKDGTKKFPSGDDSLVNVAPSQEFLCQPGFNYMDDCNTCTCGRDGKGAACTFKFCGHSSDERVVAPKVCEPGKNFKIECNNCMCSRDGTSVACTKMACPKADDETAKNPLVRTEPATQFLCQPGFSYKEDCNDCKCDLDGKSRACTLKYCPHSSDERVAAPKVCEPGKNFKIECNNCMCSRDGTSVACTKMACPKVNDETAKNPERATQFLCQPGFSYKEDCNDCKCGLDGKSRACTLQYCPHSSDERVAAPKVCEAGSNFKIDCNRCRCSRDGTAIACTKMACPKMKDEKNSLVPIDHAAEFLCQPGYSYNDGCNTCTCGKDGKPSVCTLKFCLNNDERVVAPKVCEPEASFNIDCNVCRCSRDGTAVACTRKACPAHEAK